MAVFLQPTLSLWAASPLKPCLRAWRSSRTRCFISWMIHSILKLINLLRFTSGKEDPNLGWILDHSSRTVFMLSLLWTAISSLTFKLHSLQGADSPSAQNVCNTLLFWGVFKAAVGIRAGSSQQILGLKCLGQITVVIRNDSWWKSFIHVATLINE